MIEGIDGSGTTTQTERVCAALRERGRQVLGTREPSSGPVGRLLRELLLGQHGPASASATPETMALLFAADRRDHLAREIEPALAGGQDVVCDRYQWSSIAYQASESLSVSWLAALGRGIREPDLTLLLDLPPGVAARRRQLAGRPTERYDADAFQARVARHYRELARADARAVVIDGSQDVDTVTRALLAEVLQRLDDAPIRLPQGAMP